MLVTKAGLAGTGGHDRRSRTMGRGLSELRGLGLVYIESLVYGNVNVPSWRNVLTYLKDL